MERTLLSGRIKIKSWSGKKEFAQAVCQEKGQVELLLPPGAEVHSWRPWPTDIVRLAKADLFIYIGADLEPWIHDFLKGINNPKLKTLEVSRNLSLEAGKQTSLSQIEEYHKLYPNIWLDFQVDQMIIKKIALSLSEIDPHNSLFYNKNSELYQECLQKLDEGFRDTLQDCAQRIFILGGHSAFGHLAYRYKRLIYHGTHGEFCQSQAFKDMLAAGNHIISHPH